MDGRIELWSGGPQRPVWRPAPELQVSEVAGRIPTDTLADSGDVLHPHADLRFLARSGEAGRPVFDANGTGQGRREAFHFYDTVVIPPSPEPGWVRRVSLLTRQPQLSREEFRRAWHGRHADLVRQLPGCIGYIQSLLVPLEPDGGPGGCIDGIAQLFFAGEDRMKAAYGSSARDALRADARTFIGRIATFRLIDAAP